MTDATGIRAPDPDGAAADVPTLDEATFLKTAKRRSTRRILLLAGALVVAAVIVLGAALSLWHWRLQSQSERIDGYCLPLISISSPNTRILLPGTTRTRFPGAVNEYLAYRTVGDVLVPVGEVSVEFDVWGGEQMRGVSSNLWMTSVARSDNGRRFAASPPAPQLSFLIPAEVSELPIDRADTASIEPTPATHDEELVSAELAEFAAETESSLSRLMSAPPDSTVELAVSFRTTISLAQVESLLGKNLELSWGATFVYPDSTLAGSVQTGHLVGVDFSRAGMNPSVVGWETRQQAEDQLTARLRGIAESAPHGTADLCLKSAKYLEEHGVSYFGVVVCGSPEAALALARDSLVSAVSLGLVVMPWE